jgi:hypothetical protein
VAIRGKVRGRYRRGPPDEWPGSRPHDGAPRDRGRARGHGARAGTAGMSRRQRSGGVP